MAKAKRSRKAKPRLQVDAVPPTEAQLRNGDFERDFVTHVDTNTKSMAYRNRGGSTLQRWLSAKPRPKLDDRQQAVIKWMLRLWSLAGVSQRVTASYGERIPGTSCGQIAAAREVDARQDLKRVDGYFPGSTRHYLDVFEDIVRHGKSAGEAGAIDGFHGKSAQTRALTIVRFVCDVIGAHERHLA